MRVSDNASPCLGADAPAWLLLRATLLFRQTTLLREQVGVGACPTQNVLKAYCISVDLRTDDEHFILMIAPGCALVQPERSEHQFLWIQDGYRKLNSRVKTVQRPIKVKKAQLCSGDEKPEIRVNRLVTLRAP